MKNKYETFTPKKVCMKRMENKYFFLTRWGKKKKIIWQNYIFSKSPHIQEYCLQ